VRKSLDTTATGALSGSGDWNEPAQRPDDEED
jgi:hypothetical protein